MRKTENNRASVLGEFGVQALVVEDHLWLTDFSEAPSHYETSQSRKKLHNKYDQLIRDLVPPWRKKVWLLPFIHEQPMWRVR